jgi:hypothetical protein
MARVVDEHVQRLALREERLGARAHAVEIGEIERGELGVSAGGDDGLDDGLRLVARSGREDDASAAVRELLGGDAADARVRARHHHDLPGEILVRHRGDDGTAKPPRSSAVSVTRSRRRRLRPRRRC